MVNTNNIKGDFYPVGIWLYKEGRSMRWLSHKLEVSEGTIYRWKATDKIPYRWKLALTHLYWRDTNSRTLFDEVL